MAMGKMQFQHFLAKGSLVYALLCKCLELARISQDLFKHMCRWVHFIDMTNREPMLSNEVRQEWEPLIRKLKTKDVDPKSQ